MNVPDLALIVALLFVVVCKGWVLLHEWLGVVASRPPKIVLLVDVLSTVVICGWICYLAVTR